MLHLEALFLWSVQYISSSPCLPSLPATSGSGPASVFCCFSGGIITATYCCFRCSLSCGTLRFPSPAMIGTVMNSSGGSALAERDFTISALVLSFERECMLVCAGGQGVGDAVDGLCGGQVCRVVPARARGRANRGVRIRGVPPHRPALLRLARPPRPQRRRGAPHALDRLPAPTHLFYACMAQWSDQLICACWDGLDTYQSKTGSQVV